MDGDNMKREDRAKQFMPFAALKGYYEMIREVERQKEGENNSKICLKKWGCSKLKKNKIL